MSLQAMTKARKLELKYREEKEALICASDEPVEDIAKAVGMSVRGVYALLARRQG